VRRQPWLLALCSPEGLCTHIAGLKLRLCCESACWCRLERSWRCRKCSSEPVTVAGFFRLSKAQLPWLRNCLDGSRSKRVLPSCCHIDWRQRQLIEAAYAPGQGVHTQSGHRVGPPVMAWRAGHGFRSCDRSAPSTLTARASRSPSGFGQARFAACISAALPGDCARRTLAYPCPINESAMGLGGAVHMRGCGFRLH